MKLLEIPTYFADVPGELIPIVAILMTFSIPLVAILVNHQRKMAELIHQNHIASMQPNAETEAMRRELSEMKQLIHQQTIAMDDLRSQLGTRQATPPDVSSRFNA